MHFSIFVSFLGSTPLPVNASTVFVGLFITITCKPPDRLNFGDTLSAMWSCEGGEITNSIEYSINTDGRTSNLTVNGFYRINDGKKLI